MEPIELTVCYEMRTMPRVPRKPKGANEVGQNVRRLREAMRNEAQKIDRQSPDWTREDLSRRSGVAPATIANIELGYVTASTESLQRLAAALGVSLADLAEPHGTTELDRVIKEFTASDWAKRLPGGPPTVAELTYLRRFPAATWERLPPTPEALHYIVLAVRTNPSLLLKR